MPSVRSLLTLLNTAAAAVGSAQHNPVRLPPLDSTALTAHPHVHPFWPHPILDRSLWDHPVSEDTGRATLGGQYVKSELKSRKLETDQSGLVDTLYPEARKNLFEAQKNSTFDRNHTYRGNLTEYLKGFKQTVINASSLRDTFRYQSTGNRLTLEGIFCPNLKIIGDLSNVAFINCQLPGLEVEGSVTDARFKGCDIRRGSISGDADFETVGSNFKEFHFKGKLNLNDEWTKSQTEFPSSIEQAARESALSIFTGANVSQLSNAPNSFSQPQGLVKYAGVWGLDFSKATIDFCGKKVPAVPASTKAPNPYTPHVLSMRGQQSIPVPSGGFEVAVLGKAQCGNRTMFGSPEVLKEWLETMSVGEPITFFTEEAPGRLPVCILSKWPYITNAYVLRLWGNLFDSMHRQDKKYPIDPQDIVLLQPPVKSAQEISKRFLWHSGGLYSMDMVGKHELRHVQGAPHDHERALYYEDPPRQTANGSKAPIPIQAILGMPYRYTGGNDPLTPMWVLDFARKDGSELPEKVAVHPERYPADFNTEGHVFDECPERAEWSTENGTTFITFNWKSGECKEPDIDRILEDRFFATMVGETQENRQLMTSATVASHEEDDTVIYYPPRFMVAPFTTDPVEVQVSGDWPAAIEGGLCSIDAIFSQDLHIEASAGNLTEVINSHPQIRAGLMTALARVKKIEDAKIFTDLMVGCDVTQNQTQSKHTIVVQLSNQYTKTKLSKRGENLFPDFWPAEEQDSCEVPSPSPGEAPPLPTAPAPLPPPVPSPGHRKSPAPAPGEAASDDLPHNTADPESASQPPTWLIPTVGGISVLIVIGGVKFWLKYSNQDTESKDVQDTESDAVQDLESKDVQDLESADLRIQDLESADVMAALELDAAQDLESKDVQDLELAKIHGEAAVKNYPAPTFRTVSKYVVVPSELGI